MTANHTMKARLLGLASARRNIRHQLLIALVISLLAGSVAAWGAYLAGSALGIAYQKDRLIEYETGADQIESASRTLATLIGARESAGGDNQVQVLIDVFSTSATAHSLRIWLTDAGGKVLATSLNTFGGRLAPPPATKRNAALPGGEFTVVSPVRLGAGSGWLTVSGLPEGRAALRERWSPLGAVTGGAVFLLAFYLLVGRKLRYLREMEAGLRQIAAGRFTSRVPVSGHDELAALAGSINLMAAELEQKVVAERASEQARRELVTNLSHDLKTPLTSVKAYLHLLLGGRYSSQTEMEEYIRVAYSNTEQLQSMVEDLFEYARLSGGEVRLNRQKTCLSTLVSQFAAEHAPLAAARQMGIGCKVPEQKVCCEVDPTLLVRVLENLLSNALKYGHAPGEIRMLLQEEDGGVRITVSNPGPPIPSEQLARLFDRFYRLDTARSAVVPGSGLGLAIARTIIELHGGRIWAGSGGGLVSFQIWLPGSPFQLG